MEQAAPLDLIGMGVVFLVVLIFILAFLVLTIIIWCQIFKKAGYHPAMGLLMLLPPVNIVMLFVLAFSRWPIYERLSQSIQIKGEEE